MLANSQAIRAYEMKRLVEVGHEVLVIHEGEKNDGNRFRNTELFGFEADKISTSEVYFG